MPSAPVLARSRGVRRSTRLAALLAATAILAGCGSHGGDSTSAAGTSPEEQARALATQYVTALEKGDATTLLSFERKVEGQTTLPAEAYAEALKKSPVTNASVGTPTLKTEGLGDGTVPVTFSLGGQNVSATLSVDDYDEDGTWKLVNGLGRTERLSSLYEGLPATLNGSSVPADTPLLLLPGTYTVGTGNEVFGLDGSPDVLITAPGTPPTWPSPVLSDAGQQSFREAVTRDVEACAAQKTLAAGCGIDPVPASTSDGWTVVDGTVERTLTDSERAKLTSMTADVQPAHAGTVTGDVVSLTTRAHCTKDGAEEMCQLVLGGGTGVPTVNMLDPALPVSWK